LISLLLILERIKMGYFEGLTNASFKKDQTGSTVFYPWGVLGKGRILEDPAVEARLRKFVSRFHKISLPVTIGVGAIVGWSWSLILIPLFSAWFYFGSKALISDSSYSDQKMKLKEGYANSAAGHSKLTLWLLFLCSVVFVMAGVLISIFAKSVNETAMGVSVTIFFGACGIAVGYMLKVKQGK
jgi:hypothetical protein